MRLPRTRKGISPIIATTLLILIAIATGIVIYAFAAGWVGTRVSDASGPQAVLVVESGYWDNNHAKFVLYIRNDGGKATKIVRGYIDLPDGTTYQLSESHIRDENNNPKPLIPPDGKPRKVEIKNLPSDVVGKIRSGYVCIIRLIGNDESEVTVKIRI